MTAGLMLAVESCQIDDGCTVWSCWLQAIEGGSMCLATGASEQEALDGGIAALREAIGEDPRDEDHA